METKKAFLLFPNQLFESASKDSRGSAVYLIEDPLFFSQYKFHFKKLILHRASMKAYFKEHFSKQKQAYYLELREVPNMKALADRLNKDAIKQVRYYDPVDDWLERRLFREFTKLKIEAEVLETPGFFCGRSLCEKYFKGKKKYLLHHFYVSERKRLNLLMDNGMPVGGRWSLDQENRSRIPKAEKIPRIQWPGRHPEISEAEAYVAKYYPLNYGGAQAITYPVTRKEALKMLDDFLDERFEKYGAYQDAIKRDEAFLFHSLLTPALNIGLITPQEAVERAVKKAEKNKVPLNSLEGFIRQIVGWREFIRGVYVYSGRKQRTTNYWKHKRKIPDSFWTGQTGIEPVDTVIRRVLKTAYAHHIERLMILGNFMLLCEFDPDEIYRWFMELFIDAYDWVMVPNVYGMSQFADGGLMSTKPYISSSNYVLKMSDFQRGPWCELWDGLFWRFIDKHREFFGTHPRLNMMTRQLDKMSAEKKKQLFSKAEHYLEGLA